MRTLEPSIDGLASKKLPSRKSLVAKSSNSGLQATTNVLPSLDKLSIFHLPRPQKHRFGRLGESCLANDFPRITRNERRVRRYLTYLPGNKRGGVMPVLHVHKNWPSFGRLVQQRPEFAKL